MASMVRACSTFWVLFSVLVLAGCPEKTPAPVSDAAAVAAIPVPLEAAAASASAFAHVGSAPADGGGDAAEMRRFDPKYKCPTGQTHFYLEGDFCRKKCFSASDCAKGERCSAMEYPFLVDGKPGASGHFCEGT